MNPLVAVLVAAVAVVIWMVAWSVYFVRCRNRLTVIRTDWIERFQGNEAEQQQRYDALTQRTAEVSRLLRGAGVADGHVSYANPIGWNRLVTGQASLYENWLLASHDVPTMMNAALLRAIGVYDDRRRHALNPLWWIGLILTAPQHLVRWVGGTGEGALTKLGTLIWAIVAGLGVLLGIVVSLKNLLGI